MKPIKILLLLTCSLWFAGQATGALVYADTAAATVTQEERKQPRNFEDLVVQLDDASPGARRWAARDLVYYPEASAALVGRLRREQEPSVRECSSQR